jgi:glycosyltransferase involved in cell wall biosynthesis
MPRALFVSYAFPPVGGGGVQRLTKWLKYLPEHGWESSVITAGNPSVPLTDRSLGPDVPATARIVRARTLEPSYALKVAVAGGVGVGPTVSMTGLRRLARAAGGVLLQPDPQILWAPAAARAGRRLLSELPHDVVVATGPPFSTFMVGVSLARAAGLPLVLDFRDEWDLASSYGENRSRDPVSRLVQGRMQARALRRAQLVMATTRQSARALAEKCRAVRSGARTLCIYNGYDEDDFTADATTETGSGRFRLAYVGTLWALTDASPLLSGLHCLAEKHPDIAARVDVVFAGRKTDAQSALLAGLEGLPFGLSQSGYVPHSEAVRIMRSSNGL